MTKTIYSFLIVALVTLVGGCTVPIQKVQLTSTFDEPLAKRQMEAGPNTVEGSALIRQQGGGIVTCAGNNVWIIPVTEYSTERIRIFPNPASSVVNFLFEHPDFINSLLLLFSADGKLVNEIVVCDQNVSVDITGYKQGVYFYNWIITENEFEAGKFVVE